jgi:ATP-dependent protease ClpP protease subunit
MAGRRITMAKSAKMMIHSPYTVVQGNADDMRKMADLLDKYTETMIDIYQTKVRMTRSFIKDLLQRETWFNAYQCLELKFCDAVEE